MLKNWIKEIVTTGGKVKRLHPLLLYINQAISEVVGKVKTPTGEENSDKVVRLVLGTPVGMELVVVTADGGT